MEQTSEPVSSLGKPVALAIAAGMLAIGLIMALHGLGFVSAQWLNPNPLTPHWVFALIGAILILSAWLTLGTAWKIPKRSIAVAGYSTIVLSLAAAHWLIFFAEGASCSIDTGDLFFAMPGFLCIATMGLALIGLDLILALAAIASMRTRRTG